ncbi:hypothetical protein LNA02_03710 [Levilactobacillus namurensis]|nr:DUF87 domain-containing protein [Levilactobacillus namurensis]GEO73673.1 hypothetical protein LNA02_03710 [Levilactobacillus namurensis]
MLEEYYKFLCKRLVAWANKVEISPGDRYVLSFEESQQVRNFMNELGRLGEVEQLQISQGESGFAGLAIMLNQPVSMKLVVVSTNNVTPDYLVNLRNQIGRQQGIWKDTALLFVSNQILDSINSGAKDISRQGGPFNLDELRKNLEFEIQQSKSLNLKEQQILKVMVRSFFKGEQTLTLMDFADAYAILEKGNIDPDDYTKMGYFQDKSLMTFDDDDIEKRLENNHDDFAEINMIRGFGDTKEKLEKLVTGDHLKVDLAGNDWQKVDYKRILEGKAELAETNQVKIAYLPDQLLKDNADLQIWDRPQKMTKAGQRNRQLIIFNPMGQSELVLRIPFDKSIKRDGLSNKTEKSTNPKVSISGHHLKLTFNLLNDSEATSTKIVYKHQNKGSLRFTFNIVILPIVPALISALRPFYSLSIGSKQSYTINLPSDIADFELGTGVKEEIIAHSISDLDGLRVTKWKKIVIKTSDLILNDDADEKFELLIGNLKIPFLFVDEEERIVPRNAVYLENFRRQHSIDGHYRNKQVFFGEMACSVYESQKRFLDLEFEAIHDNQLIVDSDYEGFDLEDSLKKAYGSLFFELRRRQTTMSLVIWDEEIQRLVQAILDEVQSEIDTQEDRIELPIKIQNIVHIGEFNIDGDIAYAPFNPMLLAYQLQVEQEVGQENLSDTIQRKLNPTHLVPYLKREGVAYKTDYISNAPRWLIYSKTKLSKFSEVSQRIITERLKDFKKHFDYLFTLNPQIKYNVRAVNIKDERLLIKSITDYLIFEISQNKEDLSQINPVSLHIINRENQHLNPDVNQFYKIHTRSDYESFFHQPLKSIQDVNSDQIIETLQNKLDIFYGESQEINYHITFYQFTNQLTLGQYSTEQLTMNYSIDGLIGGDEYTNVQNSIKSGFGTKGLSEIKMSGALKMAKAWNELLVATVQKHAVMSHGQSLTNSIEEVDDREFQRQFDGSKWVTLLNPEVKLDYFSQMNHNIYVIHYTDYTNSANYESITLTKKVHQYEIILSDNLPDTVDGRNNQDFLTTIIKSFNVLNGEWLLRLVSHRNQGNTVREKLSIMAVYKEMLGILNSSRVIWIPLSLEEILRVSGSFVGETRNDSIFSAKSLGAQGKISDDLLFIGLWDYEGQLKVTFLPTEVKVGKNADQVISKADTQVEKTFNVLKKFIFDAIDFKSDFYLDFFMKLYFANAAKLFSNGEMSVDVYQQLQQYRQSVSQGKLKVDNTLTDVYRNKFIFSLKRDVTNRSLRVNEDYTLVEVPENDAYRISGIKTQRVIDSVQNDQMGFDVSRLLSHISQKDGEAYRQLTNAENHSKTQEDNLRQPVVAQSEVAEKALLDSKVETGSMSEETVIQDESGVSQSDVELTASNDIQEARPEPRDLNKPSLVYSESSKESLKGTHLRGNRRILLGTVDGSSQKAYWEYDDHQLANRHMLITGKSGQGKTYFIQTLLYEFSRNKIDSLIIDYTDSYLPNQLDRTLKEAVPNIRQHIVMKEHLAINPFKYNKYSIGDYQYYEKTENVVARVAEVLDFVFGLGIQQKSRLITIMNEGMAKNKNYTFSKLKDQLSEDKNDRTLYGRLQTLLDNDPFTYGKTNFDWSSYFGSTGQINIIQLSHYPASVQKAMIEFVLWDLFNYSQMYTDRHLVYPVFLDEVQNLNFAREAPTFKILTEGRKFGWSGIFATQSLSSIKGEVDSIYNTAEQVHFLPPESQTRAIAKTLSSNHNRQKMYEQELSTLQKGQCVVNGPELGENDRLIKTANIINIDSLESRVSRE